MKRVLSMLVASLILISATCQAAFVYPQYSGANQNEVKVKERVNIVYDNSGHPRVKEMFIDIISAASIAEDSEIWIYPIAGTVKPVKVEPGKDFIEKNFNSYSKSSNEFKEENVIDKAIADLNKDKSSKSKRFVLYADISTSEKRSEYRLHNGMKTYLTENPDIKFSVMSSYGTMVEFRSVADFNHFGMSSDEGANINNYDYMSDIDGLFEFMIIKNGYSLGEAAYDKENGVIKIEKGKADNNIFVRISGRENRYVHTKDGSGEAEVAVYLGGCMMGTDAYNKYLKKSKVSSVALSYNHVVMEAKDDGYAISSALYTADGECVNPSEDDLYIPAINAENVVVYHRNTKGSGVCTKKTSYKTNQDKEIINASAPSDSEEDVFALATGSKNPVSSSTNRSFFSIVGSIIRKIFTIIFALLRLLIFACIILFIAHKKFRSYIQLKILDSKFGPSYEKLVKKVKKIISDIAGSGVKIRGDADLKGDYIFISKASADMGLPNNRISLVVKELESRGIKCWLSENGIKPGQDYNVVLPEAIKSCTMFLLFISPMSVKSAEVISEIGTAKEHKKTIIPVQIEPFDLFKEYPNWAYMLKQFQKTDLFASKTDEIKALADLIEKSYNELKK